MAQTLINKYRSMNGSDNVCAELIYVDAPTEAQLSGIRKKLISRYGAEDISIKLTEDKSIIGGFIIRCCDEEIDYSIKKRIDSLQQKLIRR